MKTSKLVWLFVSMVLVACGGEDPQIPFGLGAKGDGEGSADEVYVVELQTRAPGVVHDCQSPTNQAIQKQGCLLIASTTKGDLVAVRNNLTQEIASAMDSKTPTAGDGIGARSYALAGTAFLVGWGVWELGTVVFSGLALHVLIHQEEIARQLMDVVQEIRADGFSPQASSLADAITEKTTVWGTIDADDISATMKKTTGLFRPCAAALALPLGVFVGSETVNAIVCHDKKSLVVRPRWIDRRSSTLLNITNIGKLPVAVDGVATLPAGATVELPVVSPSMTFARAAGLVSSIQVDDYSYMHPY